MLLVAGLALAYLAVSALGAAGSRSAGATLPSTAAQRLAPAAGFSDNSGSTPATQGTHSTPGGAAAPAATTGVALVVLDNTGRPDVARSATERFEQAGWTVTDTSTFDGDILSTAAYYDPSAAGAQAAAEALQTQFPQIQRVRPKFDGLGSGAVIVVLTYDYSRDQTTS